MEGIIDAATRQRVARRDWWYMGGHATKATGHPPTGNGSDESATDSGFPWSPMATS